MQELFFYRDEQIYVVHIAYVAFMTVWSVWLGFAAWGIADTIWWCIGGFMLWVAVFMFTRRRRAITDDDGVV